MKYKNKTVIIIEYGLFKILILLYVSCVSKDNEAIRNSRMKLTGDMDLISHFGLYYLYEMSKNKKVDENSDYQSYINDLPSNIIDYINKMIIIKFFIIIIILLIYVYFFKKKNCFNI